MKKIIIGLVVIVIVALTIPHFLYSYRDYNLVVVTLDTTRADYLRAYNPKAAPTPHFDRIVSESMLFEKAYSLIPITFPAHSAMFLSRPPHELSLFNNGDVLTDKTPTLAELLAKRGYKTGAFLSLGSLKKIFGLNRGFQTYEETFKHRWYSLASEVNEAAMPWIRQNAKEKFFAWVHYSDPHFPYVTVDAPPDTEVIANGVSIEKVWMARKERTEVDFMAKPGENTIVFRSLLPSTLRTYMDPIGTSKKNFIEIDYRDGWQEEEKKERKEKKKPEKADNPIRFFVGQATLLVHNRSTNQERVRVRFSGKLAQPVEEVRRSYASEVKYMDGELGRLWDLLDELNLRKKTIVLMTADHGEALGERKRIGHLFPLVEQLTHVPFVIYYPGLGRSGRSSELVSHLDILPTVLDLMGIKNESSMRGRSLKRSLSWSPVDLVFASNEQRTRVFSETYAPQGKSNSFAMVERHWKLSQTRQNEGWKRELYNLQKDSAEKTNIFSSPGDLSPQALNGMRAVLEEYGNDAEAKHKARKNPELDEDAKKMLRDLGYIN